MGGGHSGWMIRIRAKSILFVRIHTNASSRNSLRGCNRGRVIMAQARASTGSIVPATVALV